MQQHPTLILPAFTAYVEPNPEGIEISEEHGASAWSDGTQQLVWYGLLGAGTLQLGLKVKIENNTKTTLRWTIQRVNEPGRWQKIQQGTVVVGQSGEVLLGTAMLKTRAYYRIALEGIARTGATFGEVESLLLSGEATQGAQFNLLERRNAASVHLGYPLSSVGSDARVVAFYNEITIRTEPLYSYYMACGFRRGYFGIQVNSPTERRIIFSIWDAGNEAVSRDKVPEENQVKLLAKGEGVVASGFGNEGTGGHSHLIYPWRRDTPYRFLVTAEPRAPHTIYTAYFWFPERKAWGLIASFRAPKDGNTLSGLYSFNENFGGSNGQLQRLAEFGPQWVLSDTGVWTELTTARFTHDATGKKDRLDYAMGVTKGGEFFLSNGGFFANGVKLGDTRTRPASKKLPDALKALKDIKAMPPKL
jgi:hypothetical protein